MSWKLFVLFSLLNLSCIPASKKAGNSVEGVEAIPAGVSALQGTWKLVNASVENKSNMAIVISGLFERRIRANGTYIDEMDSFTLSTGGEDIYKVCTALESGDFRLQKKTGITSNSMLVALSGDCAGAKIGVMTSEANESADYTFIANNKLQMAVPFSVKDETLGSRQERLLFTYEKTDGEYWSGIGIDPEFDGKWQVKKMFITSTCGDAKDVTSELVFSGSEVFSVYGSRYSVDRQAFKADKNFECTGFSQGSLVTSSLALDQTQTYLSTECMRDPVNQTTIDKRHIPTFKKYVAMKTTTESNSSCNGQSMKKQQLTISERR